MNELAVKRREIGPVLILEDEVLVSSLIEDIVRELGAQDIRVFAEAEPALAVAQHDKLDCAILDVQLGRQNSFGVADVLEQRGIPFLFSSAYGPESLEERHRQRPMLSKPFSDGELRGALLSLLRHECM